MATTGTVVRQQPRHRRTILAPLEELRCAQLSCTARATSGSRTSPTRASSSRPTPSSASPAPASAAATSGRTTRWSTSETGRRMGHEFIGVVEEVGADVRTVKPGDLVVAPFAWSDGTCVFCHEGLQTSCLHGGFWGRDGVDGGQGEAVRVPQADGTLVVLPGRRGRRADAVAADALRRDGDRPPRGARRAGRARARRRPSSATAPSASAA